MKLFKIQHELIADTTADAWYRIMVAGPAFHYRWSSGSGSDGELSSIVGEHVGHAVCRAEPCLTMSWGMDVHDRTDLSELRFNWADQFVNKTVVPFWVDFFWNNALIDRVELARIDGSHGTIPMPGRGTEVTNFQVAVAYLVDGLEDSPGYDNPGHYLDMIHAKRVHDVSRGGAGSLG
jgi:hypothetical protein